ncbi:unnamed protein product [Cyclocybe aegerita]|uniref:Uncharacterized protein n=1 Tax=Cyclocybe aegerita TaxID=1973307 RepID=A0A8S0XWN2_CYCAE|nr:unnamed protein product [Cyclocybe aegerita]
MSTATTTWLSYTAPPDFPQGARGYLKGTIPNLAAHPLAAPIPPSPLTTTPIITTTTALPSTAALTPWTYASPTAEEWDIRDAWAMGLLTWNVKNVVGLGVKTDGMVAQAWTSLKSQYETTSDLAAVLADTELHLIKFHNGDNLPTHIANLRSKWAYANSVGVEILDRDFHIILLQSLPPTPVWEAFTLTLYELKTAAKVITQITLHWQRISRNSTVATPREATPTMSATGLGGERQANSHLASHGGASGPTSTSTPSVGTPTATASAAVVKMAYALMAMTGGWDEGGGTREHVVSFIPMEDEPTALAAMSSGGGELLTYVNSGASDHCFANKIDFSTYEPFHELRKGQAAC